MKLINILDNLDILSEVVIWNFNEAEDTNWEEPTFEGMRNGRSILSD